MKRTKRLGVAGLVTISVLLLGAAGQVTRQEFDRLEQRLDDLEQMLRWNGKDIQSHVKRLSERVDALEYRLKQLETRQKAEQEKSHGEPEPIGAKLPTIQLPQVLRIYPTPARVWKWPADQRLALEQSLDNLRGRTLVGRAIVDEIQTKDGICNVTLVAGKHNIKFKLPVNEAAGLKKARLVRFQGKIVGWRIFAGEGYGPTLEEVQLK